MLKTVSSITNAIGALNYKGTWNASTNSPALASGVGTKGDYYVVSVAGSTTLDGISTWYVGDWAVFNGSVWQRLEGGVDDPALSLKSNSTTGLMQITGPAAGQTRVVTIPDANATMARTDAAQSFTGDQTLSTGNLVVGTSGKGIDFSATSGSGTSEIFSDYEEGTWTPVPKDAGGDQPSAFFVLEGRYTKIGRMVIATAFMSIQTPGTFTEFDTIEGLPFAAANFGQNFCRYGASYSFNVANSARGDGGPYVRENTSIITVGGTAGGSVGAQMHVTVVYQTA